MLSTRHRFLFIHVPKTGGNSIQSVLGAYSDDRIVKVHDFQDGIDRFEVRSDKFRTEKHSILRDYRREYGDSLLEGLYKFSCIRNPWDRCISHYFSPHRGVTHWNSEAFIHFVREQVRPLRHFLAMDADAQDSLQACLGPVDTVLRFECLQADFDGVCERLSLPRAELPHRNASGKGDYREFYDARTAGVVAEQFADEIEYFGYSL